MIDPQEMRPPAPPLRSLDRGANGTCSASNHGATANPENYLHGTPNELNLKLSYALRYPYRKGGNPMTVRFRLNGNPVEFDGADDLSLLWYLRDHEKLTGTRFGCGIASCGAC